MANLSPQISDRNQYLGELQGSMYGQSSIMPEWAAQMQRLTPMLQYSQQQGLLGQAQSNLGMYQQLLQPYQDFQNQYGQSQMQFMNTLGQQGTKAAYQGMGDWQRNLYDTMGSQANSDLALGSQLNEQESTLASQAARAAMEARGIQFSPNQAVGQEVLNNYNLGQQRLQQRRQFAQNAFQNAMGVQQLGLQGYANPVAQGAQMFGLGGGIAAAGAGYEGLGQSSFLQPESQYYANIRGTRVQSENAALAASAQKSSGILSGLGSLFGGFIGAGKFGTT